MRILFLDLRNWAETDEAGDPSLTSPVLPGSLDTAVRHLESVVATLPRWRVELADPQSGRLHLTHRTRVCRFVDDIHLRLETVDGGCRVHARSKSRLGLIDFGQNRRNLRELLAALRGV